MAEQWRLVEVPEPEEFKDGPVLDGEEITLGFDHRVQDFLGMLSHKVLEAPSDDWIVPFLLVCLQRWDYYGHELTRKMIDLGFGATHSEAMYRALQQIENEGLIVSELQGLDYNLSRQRYAITELGEAYLEYLANALAQYQKEIDRFFQIYNEQYIPGIRG